MDHQPRSRICSKKGARDRLIRLAATHPDWALDFEDETWFSRLAQPSVHAWADAGRPWRLEVKGWIQVKREGTGVRILSCPLPTKSPWVNPSNLAGSMPNAEWWRPTGCSVAGNWPNESVMTLAVLMKSI
jgi:hypothetical protein